MGKWEESYKNIHSYVKTEEKEWFGEAGEGGKLGSNQVPLRNKEFKLTVDYTKVVQQKKQQKVC